MKKDNEALTQDQLLELNSSLGQKLEASKVLITDSKERIEKLEGEKSKLEEDMTEVEALKAKIAELEAQLAETEEAKTESQEGIDRATAIISDMAELGTKDEITAKVEAFDGLQEANSEMSTKLESYEAIGTADEIFEVFGEFKEIKLEASASELGAELGITSDKARMAIDKFESVADAKDFLSQFVLKAEAVAAEPETVEVIEKVESAGAGAEVEEVAKVETSTAMDELKQYMSKLG